MRRRIVSFFAALLVAALMLPVSVLSASADEKTVLSQNDVDPTHSGLADFFESEDGMFTDAEEEDINEVIRKCAENLQMNIVVYISNQRLSESQAEIFADDMYDEYYGEDTDGVFYYMDFSGQSPAHDYISTSGKAVLLYQDHIEDIFSVMDTYLPPSSVSDYSSYKDNIGNGIKQFTVLLEKYYSEGVSDPFAYYYDESSGKYFYFKDGQFMMGEGKPRSVKLLMWVISSVTGFIVGLIVYFANKARYKFKSSANPGVYVSKNDTVFTRKIDTFLHTHTSRVRIESSSGGGGGGGHSHSGGHGGGGHSR